MRKILRDIRWALRNGIDDSRKVLLPPGYKDWKDQRDYPVPGMYVSPDSYESSPPPPVPNTPPPGYVLTYSDDLVTSFTVAPHGQDASGNGVWTSEEAYNVRKNVWYAPRVDATIAPFQALSANPFPSVSGKRALRAEQLASNYTWTDPEDWGGETYTGRLTGAVLKSIYFMHFQYGYIEAKMKLSAVDGITSAFWLLETSRSWPPEIDIVEQQRNSGAYAGNVTKIGLYQHWEDPPSSGEHTNIGEVVTLSAVPGITATDLGNEFHRYGALVTPTNIQYYVDDVLLRTEPNNSPGVRWYVVLSNDQTVAVNPANLPADVVVEYVKLWTPEAYPPMINTPVSAGVGTRKLSTTRKTSLLALSNGDLTGTHNNSESLANVSIGYDYIPEGVTSSGVSDGKWYAKVELPEDGQWSFGAVNNSYWHNGYLIGLDISGIGVDHNGDIYFEEIIQASLWSGATSPEDTLEIATDTTGKLCWMRYNGGDWNDNASADPATGDGGIDISKMLGSVSMFAALLLSYGSSFTVLTNGTPPSGYTDLFVAPAYRTLEDGSRRLLEDGSYRLI